MNVDEAMKKIEELLPRHTRCEEDGGAHGKFCPAYYREDAIATLLAIDEQAEKRGYAKGVEAAAALIEVTDLVDPSGRSAHEQQQIWAILERAAGAIRALSTVGERSK